MSGDMVQRSLTQQVEELKKERDVFRRRVEDLEGVVEMKEREIDNLQKALQTEGQMNMGDAGISDEATKRLVDTNQRLMRQLTDMREQMRRMESMNETYTSLNQTGGSALGRI